jgi:hypothetical protein
MKKMEKQIKKIEVKGGKIYLWTCKYCGKQILSAYKKQLRFNIKQHLLWCKYKPSKPLKNRGEVI